MQRIRELLENLHAGSDYYLAWLMLIVIAIGGLALFIGLSQ